MGSYSVDMVAEDWHESGLLGLGVILNSEGAVVAYTISGSYFAGYNPAGYCYSDEGCYDFTVTRYGLGDRSQEMVGLTIAGSQNDYILPEMLWNRDREFPDLGYYTATPNPW